MNSPLPERLAQAVIPPAVLGVVTGLRQAGFQAYLVGGCVRDLLRGVAPKDFDVATSARPEEVQATFRKVIPTGLQHGTVTVLVRGHQVEVTTFRVEGEYVDGRRPSTVEFHTRVEADLSRRDFTINAMAFDPTRHELVDPFDGQVDLQRGVIRCVGVALDRFSEDGLRALRAVRFAAVLGFSLDPATQQAIPRALDVYRKVAAERVREELQKLLLSARPSVGLALLKSTGLLEVTFPELAALDDGAWTQTLDAVLASPSALEERFAALLLLVDSPRAVLERLKPPTRLLEDVDVLVREHRVALDLTPSDAELRQLAARVGAARAPRVVAVTCARLRALKADARVAECEQTRERLERLLAENPPLSARELALDGGAIMRLLKLTPSPAVGAATRHLLSKVLEDPRRNSPDILTQLLREWADENLTRN